MTTSGDTGQNLVGGLRPHEGLGVLNSVSNIGPDGSLKCLRPYDVSRRSCFSVSKANQRSTGEARGAGGSEVEVEARLLEQPPSDQGPLMRAIVVTD